VLIEDALINPDHKLPSIRRIVRTPVFTASGELITTAGYHACAKLYYEPPNFTIPPIPGKPTAANIAEAKRLLLDDLLVDFPFVSPADQANAIALALLPYVRDMIDGPTPLHGLEAPTAGTGKGLLLQALLMPSNSGNDVATHTTPDTDAEWSKALLAKLMEAPAHIVFDNVTKPIANGHLSSALTQPKFGGRVLGFSENMEVPVNCIWACTGNNVTIGGDIPRRYIRIRLDAQKERPEDRQDFKHKHLRSWIKANCGKLVWAALVLIQVGLNGSQFTGKRIGSYEAYCEVLGRILQNIGIDGFLGNRIEVYEAVNENALWASLFTAWYEQRQYEKTSASEAYTLARYLKLDFELQGDDDRARMVSFGKLLRSKRDSICNGYQLVLVSTKPSALWKIVAATASESQN